MDLQIQGKRAIVTGGSRGIGKAIARDLAKEGCDVAISGRDMSTLQSAADEISKATGRKVVPIVAEMLDPESLKALVAQAAQELGGVDILVNNAARTGGTYDDGFDGISEEDILEVIEEKAIGYLRCARAAATHMKQAGWGRIVNISGTAGRAPGTNLSGPMRNAAVVVMTKALSNALGPSGITVNAIYPAQTLTESTTERARQQAERAGISLEEHLEKQGQGFAIRRVPNSDDIASVATFLCSPLAGGITGEAIAVTGGAGADVHY